ncbi:MAG: glycosyltransferase family 2 protein [Cyanobacteria bacterium P01_D01_bin.71]
MTGLLISIVVPVHNGGESFKKCLASLSAVRDSFFELIVVVDGGVDDSWQAAERWGAKVIRLPQAGGPARARNLGAAAAQGDVIFFVDADVCVHPATVERVAVAFEQDDHLAALIGSYDDAPGAPNFLSQYRNLLHHFVHQTASTQATTFWGACGAVRREVFFKVGGFDERYRQPSIEDIELGYRLTAANYQIGLRKDIQVKHLKCWKAGSLLRADFFYRALPWTKLILKNKLFVNDLNLKVSSRISVALTYGILLLLVLAPLASIYGASMSAALWLVLSLFTSVMIGLNWQIYDFFWRKKGWWFMLRVIPWHWLYYLYSGLAFVIGWTRHRLSQLFPVPLSVSSVR